MGYYDSYPASYSYSSTKTAFLKSADGGVNYSKDSLCIGDNQSDYIKNMWLVDGILTSRPVFEMAQDSVCFQASSINSEATFCNNKIVHLGNKIYLFQNGEISEIFDGIDDAGSICIEFSGKLYIYCNARVFTVDRQMQVKEEFPYAPKYGYNYSPAYGVGVKDAQFIPNLIASVITVTYTEETIMSSTGYMFPKEMDKTKKFLIYLEGRLLDDSEYTYDDKKFYLNDPLKMVENNTLAISFYTTQDISGNGKYLSNCTCGTAFGGGTLDGTRIILAGNPDFPGRYFSSELADALYFKPDGGGTVGAGTEDITAFSLQGGNMLIFTSNSVYRMGYSFDSEHGGYYTVGVINNTIGCDIPGSVAIVDNRTVFANSELGIFIVDTTEKFDQLNIVSISSNIISSDGKQGFLSVDKQELRKGSSIIYDRKYMLLAGDKVFIWDYKTAAYISSYDSVKLQERLVWFEFDGFKKAKKLVSVYNRLYALKEHEGAIYAVLPQSDVLLTDGEYSFRSKNTDMDSPHLKKMFTAIKIGFKTHIETSAVIRLFADGNNFCSKQVNLCPKKDGYTECQIKIPEHSCKRFAFMVDCAASGTGILNIELNYMILKNNKNL